MAERNIDIVISAKDMTINAFKSVNEGLDGMSNKAGKLASDYVNFKSAFIAATVAVGALSIELYKAVEAANQEELAHATLRQALGYTSTALLDQASALQKVTTYQDDDIVKAQARIAMFVKDEAQIKRVTMATLDFAAAKQMDLTDAADKVAKTLGSETDALKKQGIEVTGAVGSAQRLNMLVDGLTRTFGGQAAAAAETFGGKIKQTANALNDMQEEIGYIITKNPVVITALDLMKHGFEQAAEWINQNRLMLMSYVKDGLYVLVTGIGTAIEVMRLFHNGWLGLQLVGHAVALAFAETFDVILKGLRFLLMPLDLIWQGMEKLGLIKFNPFDEAQAAITQYKTAVLDTGAATLTEIENTNKGYDAARDKITAIGNVLADIVIKQKDIEDGAKKGNIIGSKADTQEELLKLLEARKKYENEVSKLEFDVETRRGALSLAIMRSQFNQRHMTSAQYYAEESAMKDSTATRGVLLIQKEIAAENDAAQKKKVILQQNHSSNAVILAAATDHAEKIIALNDRIAASNSEVIIRHLSEAEKQTNEEVRFQQMKANILQQGADLAMGIYNATGKKHQELFFAARAMMVASTIINALAASTAAAAPPPIGFGPVLGIPIGSIILAMGFANAALIAATSFTGNGGGAGGSGSFSGGNVSAGTGSTSMATPPAQATLPPSQNVTLIINNPLSTDNWQKIAEDNIIPALNSVTDRNVVLNVGYA